MCVCRVCVHVCVRVSVCINIFKENFSWIAIHLQKMGDFISLFANLCICIWITTFHYDQVMLKWLTVPKDSKKSKVTNKTETV